MPTVTTQNWNFGPMGPGFFIKFGTPVISETSPGAGGGTRRPGTTIILQPEGTIEHDVSRADSHAEDEEVAILLLLLNCR